jgi:predicted phosphoadenosine phosphosulfate sulfurtransferase
MNSALRSNTISQRVMKPLDTDVFTAAKVRMHNIFSSYDPVVVSY